MIKSLENWQKAIREAILDSCEKVHEGIDMTNEYKIQQNKDRQEFEKWLLDVHLLKGTWNETRNCYDEFACHLAFKAWCANKDQSEKLEEKEIRPVLDKYGNVENFTPKVNGKSFRCSCGCNVFHKPDDQDLNYYRCNACSQDYTSE